MAFIAFSVLFLIGAVLSTITYSEIIVAQQEISLEDPTRSVTELPNGTVKLGLSVVLHNPSRFPVNLVSMSWYVQINNGSGSPAIITLARALYSGMGDLAVAGGEDRPFEFSGYVSGEHLALLRGFLNYSASTGNHFTTESAPYSHTLQIRGFLDDFKHDYLREDYLNELVQVNLDYTSQEDVS